MTPPRTLSELAALRLRDGVKAARLDLEQQGTLPPATWDELEARLEDLIETLPEEPLVMRSPRRIGGLRVAS
jgi:hypothetical protein